jgi:aspartate/glutamate/glutamine transport system substrate-binding protein
MALERKRAMAALLAALALALAALVGLSGCSQTSTPTNGQTLKVGVRGDVVGFGYYNSDTGKYYGLEVDIANSLATRLGYKNAELVTVTPDNRKEMLQNGEVDCVIACYSVTDSREKNFDFSPAYYTDSSVFMVEESSLITSIDQLKGKTIGTMLGTNTAAEITSQLTEEGRTSGTALSRNSDNSDVQFDTFRLLQFSSYKELSEALEVGKVDAAVMDGSIAQSYMQDNRKLLSYTGKAQSYGVATQKDSALSQPVANAIQGMIDDGTIASLTDKWD